MTVDIQKIIKTDQDHFIHPQFHPNDHKQPFVWVSGEGGPDDVQPFSKWKRDVWFRRAPDEWNEDEFVFLDQVISEAARNRLRVQLCLTNWWRDTGGVTQYLRWAGIEGADDDKIWKQTSVVSLPCTRTGARKRRSRRRRPWR